MGKGERKCLRGRTFWAWAALRSTSGHVVESLSQTMKEERSVFGLISWPKCFLKRRCGRYTRNTSLSGVKELGGR